MGNNKKQNAVAIYAAASHIAFIVLAPLLIFVVGGTSLVSRFGWPEWLNIVFVAVGILVMLSGALSYLKQLIRLFDKNESGVGTTEVRHDIKDHDYYDDNAKKKRL